MAVPLVPSTSVAAVSTKSARLAQHREAGPPANDPTKPADADDIRPVKTASPLG